MARKTIRAWLHGLAAAAISGAANAVALVIVAPEAFSVDHAFTLLKAAFACGLIAAAGYLKKSPLP